MVLSQILAVNKNLAKIRNGVKKIAKRFDFKGVKFPVHKKDFAKIEEKKKILVIIFLDSAKPKIVWIKVTTFFK